MDEYVFGANVIENLTTGMYKDSRVIYREYIQNACDQIDEAVRQHLLKDVNEGAIHIDIVESSRTITFSDNATGIPAGDFRRILGNIADSDKKIGAARGFRGIGRLCGLAYCKELVFSSKAKGERVISVMRCNAAFMRELIAENGSGKKHTANEVLNQINQFSSEKTNDIDAHWFKVELIDIREDDFALLNFDDIKQYLSFVAPVPYSQKFLYQRLVKQHASEIGFPIVEYKIYLNGELIEKNYGTRFGTTRNGQDEIFDVAFRDFRDDDDKLIAWAWYGISVFKAAIDRTCPMRGIRIRKDNIQIGNDETIQQEIDLKETRGNTYFVGEIFAVDGQLIPNSQRDYFNENASRNYFEREVKRFFDEELYRLYYFGSTINSNYNKIEVAKKKQAEFIKKDKENAFIDNDHREAERNSLEETLKKADDATAAIKRAKEKYEPESVWARLIKHVEEQHPEIDKKPTTPIQPKDGGKGHRTDKLSRYPKDVRKLITRIFNVIQDSTDSQTAEMLMKKIEDELQ